MSKKYHKIEHIDDWPKLPCMNCGELIKQDKVDVAALHPSLAHLVFAKCPECFQFFYVLLDLELKPIATYPIDASVRFAPIRFWPRARSTRFPFLSLNQKTHKRIARECQIKADNDDHKSDRQLKLFDEAVQS